MHIIKFLKSFFSLNSKQQIPTRPVECLHDKNRGIFKFIPPDSFAISDHAIDVKELSFKKFPKLNKVEKWKDLIAKKLLNGAGSNNQSLQFEYDYISTILNGLDVLVYVPDMNTHNLFL